VLVFHVSSIEVTLQNLYDELEDSIDAFNNYLNGSYQLESPYRIKDLVDLSRTYIKIRINPCKGKSSEFCCEGMNEGMCADNPVIYRGPNCPIGWSSNNYVVICNNQFFETEECGTFIEVHKPNSTYIINKIRISQLYYSGFKTESIYTRELEPGKYELWWVERDRTGRWLVYVKQFYIAY
jgi:hypothetical protein